MWLAYAAAHYLTSDRRHRDSRRKRHVSRRRRAANAGQHDAYFQPNVSDTAATFFEHCARALDDKPRTRRARLAVDRNRRLERRHESRRRAAAAARASGSDGSLHATLRALAPFALARNEIARAERWFAHATTLRESLEREGWDGNWYRRGYYDDGTPLGSAGSDECRIDSIAQSWSVISGAADTARAARAMAAVDEQLIRPDDGLALLFTPPFDRTSLDPGYVKGYPPGIRENGGQYTHAAAWSVIAFAQLGQGNQGSRAVCAC